MRPPQGTSSSPRRKRRTDAVRGTQDLRRLESTRPTTARRLALSVYSQRGASTLAPVPS